MRKLKHQDVQDFCLWFLEPRRAYSELCNQSGGENHEQKEKRDWYFIKCLIPKADKAGAPCPAVDPGTALMVVQPLLNPFHSRIFGALYNAFFWWVNLAPDIAGNLVEIDSHDVSPFLLV